MEGFLVCPDRLDEWSSARHISVDQRVAGPRHDQYALCTVDPPLASLLRPGERVRTVVLSPHYMGEKLFPPSKKRLEVFVHELMSADESSPLPIENLYLAARGVLQLG